METLYHDLINKGLQCPYCVKATEIVDSSEIYGVGTNYGKMYLCRYCDAYVGCHKGTTESLGRVANQKLRQVKIKAHEAFDQLWNRKKIDKATRRTFAYKWVSEKLKTPIEETHIGMFTIEQCEQVIELCKDYQDFINYLK
jgi:hypothetical protein